MMFQVSKNKHGIKNLIKQYSIKRLLDLKKSMNFMIENLSLCSFGS